MLWIKKFLIKRSFNSLNSNCNLKPQQYHTCKQYVFPLLYILYCKEKHTIEHYTCNIIIYTSIIKPLIKEDLIQVWQDLKWTAFDALIIRNKDEYNVVYLKFPCITLSEGSMLHKRESAMCKKRKLTSTHLFLGDQTSRCKLQDNK